jgi:O-antigen/teichoic acid export membrane protein
LPNEIAIWQLLMAAESFIMIFRFGIFNAFNREFSFLMGRNQKEKALDYLNTVDSYAIFLSIFFFFFVLIWGRGNPLEHPLYAFSLIIFAFYLPVKIYTGFLDLVFRTGQDFKKLSIIQAWSMIIYILTLILPYLMGYTGYLYRILAISISTMMLYLYFRPIKFKFDFKKQNFFYLFKTGIPLFISNYLQGIIVTIPTLMLAYFDTMTQVGLFYPVGLIISFGALLPSVISIYLLPKLNFDFGKENNVSNVIRNSMHSAFYSFLFMLPLVAFGWIFLPLFFKLFLPNYMEALHPSRLGLLLSLFNSFILLYNPFTVLKAWNPMYAYLAIMVALTIFFPLIFLNIFNPELLMESVIWGLIVARICISLLNYLILKYIESKQTSYEFT